jgi:hypothetical protein
MMYVGTASSSLGSPHPCTETSAPDAVFSLTMFLRPLLAGAVVVLLAMPAAASAAPAGPPAFTKNLERCYVSAAPGQTQPIEIAAAGFMPFAFVNVLIDNTVVTPPAGSDPPQADANGELKGFVSAPYIASGQRFFSLRLTEQVNSDATVATSAKVTALSVTASPTKPRNTKTRVRFRGRGFTERLNPIYAHYVFKDRVRQTVRIGKPFGDCGQFSVRRRQFPMRNPHVGPWIVQFDQDQAYNPNATAFARLKIVVSRKPGSQK